MGGTADQSVEDVANKVDEAALGTLASSVDTSIDCPLQVEGLEKSFGGITAVDSATFEVGSGTLTGPISPSGAGKSTAFNLITDMLEPDADTVTFNGEGITGKEPYQVANRGMVRTFQITRELSEMTVLEDMMPALKHQRGKALWRSVMLGARDDVREQEAELLERVWEVPDFFDIIRITEEYAGDLSGGQRKLLEATRVLLIDPGMLLLDEPFTGVNPTLEKKLLEHIYELREQGYTFLLIEYDMNLIMNNCEHVIVLHQGLALTERAPNEVWSNEGVIEAYLGNNV